MNKSSDAEIHRARTATMTGPKNPVHRRDYVGRDCDFGASPACPGDLLQLEMSNGDHSGNVGRELTQP
jgi:hypothetical protein